MTTSKALQELRDQADAHSLHLAKLGLTKNLVFMEWLYTKLDPKQLASLIDGEVDRKAFFEVYLNDRY